MSERNARRGTRVIIGFVLLLLLLVGGWALLAPGGLPRLGLPQLGGPDPEAFGPAVAEAHAECSRRSGAEGRTCYQETLTQLVAEGGPRAALTALEGLAAVDRSVESAAHHHAHHIGLEAYRLEPRLADVFPRCTEAFSSGCYHGVIQGHFLAHGGVDDVVLRETCAPYREPGGDRWMLFQCLHGLGHGLVLHEAGDLFRALGSCDVLDNRWERQSCYGGAFMQNIVSAKEPEGAAAGGHAHAGHAEDGHGAPAEGEPVPPALDPEDPLYPCTTLPDRYLHACYSMQSSAVLHFTDGDLGAVARACDAAPEEWRGACFEGLARDVAGRARHEPARAHRLCGRLDGDAESACYAGVPPNLVNLEAHPERAFRFCRRIEEPDDRAACFRAAGSAIRFLAADREGRADLCAPAGEPSDQEACLRGANARPR